MRKVIPSCLEQQDIEWLKKTANKARGDILTMTTLAGTGHPGGSMSSIDLLLCLYKYADLGPEQYDKGEADNMVVSIGHIAPGVYSCLGANGFINMDDAISQFRLFGSVYEGHVVRNVHGVEWSTGNLGQGLSAACGMAIADRVKGKTRRTIVLLGDGEQQKGQQAEAARFAAKYNLDSITAIVDLNGLQISGDTSSVMPQNIKGEYLAKGWAVYEVDGHDYNAFTAVFKEASEDGKPSLILAKTTMGKGVSFMENKAKYHGSPLPLDDYKKAMAELNIEPDLDRYKKLRSQYMPDLPLHPVHPVIDTLKVKPDIDYYDSNTDTDCRSAYGKTLLKIVELSAKEGADPVIVYDCDLAGSVKTTDISNNFKNHFIQSGIAEHNAATASGASSLKGVIPFFSTFTMFAIDEVYNQMRLNDINETNLKVVATHAGVDVGEDGSTHQCIDYLGLARNLFCFRVVAPADPNHTIHLTKYAAACKGNILVAMGRSKVPVITGDDNKPFFAENYNFVYGDIDKVRDGKYPLLSYGVMLHRALKVKEQLKDHVDIGVYNVTSPVHVNTKQLLELAKQGIIYVYEDHNPYSGLYATVCEILASEGIKCKVVPFGVTKYAYSGLPDKVYKLLNIDVESVAKKIMMGML